MKAVYKTKKDANGMFRLAHRVIVEEHIGRKLNRNEYVHHINGDKKDNRIVTRLIESGIFDYRIKEN